MSFCLDTTLTSTTSVAVLVWLQLSEDKRSVLFYDITNQSFAFEKKLILPGQLLKWSLDGNYLVITHDSYVMVRRPENNAHTSSAGIKFGGGSLGPPGLSSTSDTCCC